MALGQQRFMADIPPEPRYIQQLPSYRNLVVCQVERNREKKSQARGLSSQPASQPARPELSKGGRKEGAKYRVACVGLTQEAVERQGGGSGGG